MRDMTTEEFYELVTEKGINKNEEENDFTEFAKDMFRDSMKAIIEDCDRVLLYNIKNPEDGVKIVSREHIEELIENGTALKELFWKGVIPVPKDNYRKLLQMATDYYISEYNDEKDD